MHTSGALDLSVLDPAAARDALPGSFHPLRAFAAGDSGGEPVRGNHLRNRRTAVALAAA